MARPIRVIPTLEGEAAATFLKKADAAERRYFERKKAGTLKDITKDPEHQIVMKKLNNPIVL